MKIGQIDNKTSPLTTAAAAADTASAGVARVGGKHHEASATVELSQAASMLAATGTPTEFDADKVARMAAAIHQGSFHIDANAIADKLIASNAELIQRRGH